MTNKTYIHRYICIECLTDLLNNSEHWNEMYVFVSKCGGYQHQNEQMLSRPPLSRDGTRCTETENLF